MEPSAALAARALALVDLTDLSDTCTVDAIDQLCERAVGRCGHTAAVCVWPRFVSHAAFRLRGSGVAIATVVNFPAGGDGIDATVAETVRALHDGADEIDLVLPYHSFLAGNTAVAEAMVAAVRAVVHHPNRLKVILETGNYPDRGHVVAAARLAIDHGADFVKTSTGKTKVSATPDAAEAMLNVIRESGKPVGLKPSGGIRSLDDAALYLGLADRIMGPEWATPATFRFGASGLLDALEAAIEGDTGHRSDAAY